jgi:HD superfamily phosphohydrolase
MSQFEIRDPIHGRITFNEFERKVIDHPFIQRLRFISHLSFLHSYVYPGATHDRFSHALGSMHVAGRLIGKIRDSSEGVFLQLGDETWNELTQVVRLAGLLHDIGHCPLSHGLEFLLPKLTDLPFNDAWWKDGRRPYRQSVHEDYSVLLIQTLADEGILSDTIAQDVASLIHSEIAPSIWFEDLEIAVPGLHSACRQMISGEVDCDRMDYLLRDSYYCGVTYGHYDLDWMLSSLSLAQHDGGAVLAISENGVRVFESVLLARYHMIEQVYFHKTKVGFEYYLSRACRDKELLLSVSGDPHQYAGIRDGRVIELLFGAAKAGKYWSKHLIERLPAKHVMRLSETSEKDMRQLAGLVELCRREAIKYFTRQSGEAMSRVGSRADDCGIYVSCKAIAGCELISIRDYSDLLQKYNERIRFVDFFVLREDWDKFQSVVGSDRESGILNSRFPT